MTDRYFKQSHPLAGSHQMSATSPLCTAGVYTTRSTPSLPISIWLSLSLSQFSRWTWVSRCLLKQRIMEVVLTSGAINRAKLQSNHHHQQTNTKRFTGRMPFQSPNKQCQIKALKITFYGLAYPKLTWGLSTLSLTTNSSWLPWEGCHASHQPSAASVPGNTKVTSHHNVLK